MNEQMQYNTRHYQLREPLLRRMLQIIDNQRCARHGTLLFGDSQMERFPAEIAASLHLDNCGIAGATTQELLKFLDEGVLKYRPKTVYLLVGTNNLGETVMSSPREIALDVKEMTEIIQKNLPDCKVFCISVLPCLEESQSYLFTGRTIRSNDIIRIVNRELKKYLDDQFIDVFDAFLQDGIPNTKLYCDGLHLTEEGYRVLLDSVGYFGCTPDESAPQQ